MKRLRHWRHSVKLRLLLVFLLLALTLGFLFVGGAKRAFTLGWQGVAQPLLSDYVSRLAEEVAPQGSPEIERAEALVRRLPVLTIQIDGPRVRWRSQPESASPGGMRGRGPVGDEDAQWRALVQRRTADGHLMQFGVHEAAIGQRPRFFGLALLSLLGLMALAYWYVHRLLKPLDHIRAGAQRFGAGDFSQPIELPRRRRHDELGELASTVNTMGRDIEQMLQAQRALLLAISHELRSPLTRARLNTELLPESPEVEPQREALLRDLAEMARLISDLLESERLAGRQGVLQREPTDAAALARELLGELALARPEARRIRLRVQPGLPDSVLLDRVRVRLLLRNLLDNALRHGAGANEAPELSLDSTEDGALRLVVRDHGPGVPEEQIPQLAQAFYRPDSARTRDAGGVGLGLYLCRLVAQAHGGRMHIANAHPGLAVSVTLPTSA